MDESMQKNRRLQEATGIGIYEIIDDWSVNVRQIAVIHGYALN